MTERPVVIPCAELDPAIDALVGLLGFRLDMIMPADNPSIAELSGHGLRLRLDARDAPAGDTGVGRAGMIYRDLLPGRLGGRFIASHITIPDGGPVPDYVHYHDIRYQSIHCIRGWVRVVYEDQGPPFVLEEGDCVLQPPGIRHRVLESSPGLEVVEVGAPAAHPTRVDHDLQLPTGEVRPQRTFGGQRFVHHRASEGRPQPWRAEGFECVDTGITAATDGLAGARTVRSTVAGSSTQPMTHDGELLFWYVVDGKATLLLDDRRQRLAPGVAVAVPPGAAHRVVDADALELLEITLPGSLPVSG
jgi:quercetin dioxygenase-like cupin family protein